MGMLAAPHAFATIFGHIWLGIAQMVLDVPSV